MFSGTSIGRSLDIINREMSVSSLRQKVLANDIANINTPGFKASDVSFERFFKKALEHPQKKFMSFDAHHSDNSFQIPLQKAFDYKDVRPLIQPEFTLQASNNGSSETYDEQMSKLRQENLRYSLLNSMMQNDFRQLSVVLS